MKNCFNRLKVTAFFVAIATVMSCTKVDNQLGADLIPIDQTMKLKVATVNGGMETFTVKTDSIPSKNLGYLMFGKRYDQQFGQTIASSFSYFIPDAFKSEDEFFGYNPIVDSVSILMNIFKTSVSTKDGEFGPQNSKQEFGIFQANKYLSPDSTYYSTIDPKTFIDSEPLFTFNYGGTATGILFETLKVTPKGEVFLDEIINKTSADEYNIDTLFLKKYKGLYITPMDQSKEDAVIYYGTTRTDPYSTTAATINIHYHNYEKDKPIVPKNIKDTVLQSFSLTDAPEYRKLAFGVVKHDYAGSEVEQFIAKPTDTVAGTPGQQRVFVQNMAGVNSFVRFSDELSKKINSFKVVDGVEYDKIIINSAILSFGVKSASELYVLNGAEDRLGMYYSYKGYLPMPAPDYDYMYEYNSGNQVPYGGALNRLKGRYEMDITTYIQMLIINNENSELFKGIPSGVFFAPIYSNPEFEKETQVKSNAAFQGYSQVEIIGSTSPIPDDDVNSIVPKLELTFTLIK